MCQIVLFKVCVKMQHAELNCNLEKNFCYLTKNYDTKGILDDIIHFFCISDLIQLTVSRLIT